MARLRNTVTGVVVSVADTKAERFGPEWEPVGVDIAPPAPAPDKKPAAKKK